MTRSSLFLPLTLAACLAGGAALAQTPPPAPADPATPASDPMAAPMAAPATAAMMSAPAAGAEVTATTVTNGPVPDTAANRAKYGGPQSHAGKHTKPTGN